MREVDETWTSINYEIEIITKSHKLFFKSEKQEVLFSNFRVSLLLGCVLNCYLSPEGLCKCIYGPSVDTVVLCLLAFPLQMNR